MNKSVDERDREPATPAAPASQAGSQPGVEAFGPPTPRRARAAADKAARRQEILDAALQLFDEREYSAVTVAAVARRAGLAKGTVYLYFPSKEAMFLELVTSHLGPWFDRLAPDLAVVASADALGQLVAAQLAAQPVLLRLLSILHTVLERNADLETVLEFKTTVGRWIRAAAVRLEARFPGLDGIATMHRVYALIIGLYQMANHSPAVRAALAERPGLAHLLIDYERELASAIAAVLPR